MFARNKITAIIVMGVSGSGKSTIAQALARELGFLEEDGDAYHPPSNVNKMQRGIPLTDTDRAPWLRAIADTIDRHAAAGSQMVIACSVLKRAYRDVLVHGRGDVRLVYLKGARELIASRLRRRHGHFMPLALLDSQLAALEEPKPDEHAITISIDAPVDAMLAAIIAQLDLSGTTRTLAS